MRLVHLNSDRGIHPSRKKGAAVHLAAMREAFLELGAEVVAIDEPDALLAREALSDTLRMGPLGLVYERLALGAFAGSEFALEHSLAHVIEVNAPLDEEQTRYRPEAQNLGDSERLKAALQAAHLVLCVSQDCATWARSRGARPAHILVAGNGVDPRRFHPGRRAEGLTAKSIPADAFVIGFHGRLRPWHGFERLVATVQALHERGLKVHLSMVGKGDFAEVIGDALPTSCWSHIPWVDHEEVGAHVARFDCLPLTYDPNSPCYFSPLKLLEGMAAGAVAIVPDLGGLAETVQRGRAGCVYDPESLDELTEITAELCRDTQTRERLAEAGRRVAAEHSWSAIAGQVLMRCGAPVQ
jgi:glycosyltransferase involved in cell wall biosynthesis